MNEYSTSIRRARLADLERLSALWMAMMEEQAELDLRFALAPGARKRWIAYVRGELRRGSALCLVAEENGIPVGYLLATVHDHPALYAPEPYGFISDCYVVRRLRRQGVGRRLVEQAQEWFRKRGLRVFQLYIAEANLAAISFWEAIGGSPFMRRYWFRVG